MAGTPEKILEHLLEFMRLDATLYDPVGRWGPGTGGPGKGIPAPRVVTTPGVEPKKPLFSPQNPSPGLGERSISGASPPSSPTAPRLPSESSRRG